MPENPFSSSMKISGTVSSSSRNLTGAVLASVLAVLPARTAFATSAGPDAPQCQALDLSLGSAKSSDLKSETIAKVLQTFEQAFAQDDADLFVGIASASLQKKPEELKKIFDGTVLEYDLKKAKLQRNHIWSLNRGSVAQPGQTLSCGEVEVQPVFGPQYQIAVQYSVFSSGGQTRLLLILAKTPLDLKAGREFGVVLLQAQRWTYDGRNPEKLLDEGRLLASQGQTVAGHLLSEAAARVLESNPYLITPLHRKAREQAIQTAREAQQAQEILLRPAGADPKWIPQKMVPIFKEASLAVGLKLSLKTELSLNEQARRCLETSRKLFPAGTQWRASFSGVECMPYASHENIDSIPKGGSFFYSWSKIDSK
ncbi:MAG: hypothetical protein RIR26_1192 [Pseudomonadota bacterium]|jgi:hypothetical protein